MKKFIGAFVILSSLWGCGPEQSAYDRDQQQLLAQQDAFKAQLAPYLGAYYGIATPQNAKLFYQVEIVLGPGVNQLANSSNITPTNSPALKGTWNHCDDTKCFGPNKDPNSIVDNSIKITGAAPSNGVITLVSNPTQGNCGVGNAQLCIPITIMVHFSTDSTGKQILVGTYDSSDEVNTQLALYRE